MKLIEINLLNIEWNFRLMSVTSTSTRFFYAWIQMCIYLYFLIIHSHYLNRTCGRINRKEIFFRLQTLEFCHHFPTLVSRLFYQSSYKIGVKLEFRNWQHRLIQIPSVQASSICFRVELCPLCLRSALCSLHTWWISETINLFFLSFLLKTSFCHILPYGN